MEDGDCRQLLIVGTQSSGTTSTTHALRFALGLEVAHENSDASFSPCRDGTVSWVHGLRLLHGAAPPAESVRGLCSRAFTRVGFYRDTFRWPAECPEFPWRLGRWFAWDACLEAACERIVRANWGCARRELRADGAPPRGSFPTPFARTLLQVRHPLVTIASLSAKVCDDPLARPIEPEFATVVRALLPAGPWDGEAARTCLGFIGWYWLLYNEAMVGALDFEAAERTADRAAPTGVGGSADGDGGEYALSGWYRVEDTDACQIARLGGFVGERDGADGSPGARACVHPSSRARAEAACAGGGAPAPPSVAQTFWDGFVRALPFASLPGVPRKARNRRNVGNVPVTLQQLASLDETLARRVAALAERLGYADVRAGAPREGQRGATVGVES